jgi:predicted transcriptional regulator
VEETCVRRLGDLESAIMDRLWAWRRSAAVREVVDDLNQERPLAYTTVMTVMDILHRKGWVVRERVGRAYIYAAAKTRDEYVAGLIREALSEPHDRRATFAHFAESMTPAEVRAMREALDARKGGTGGSKRRA